TCATAARTQPCGATVQLAGCKPSIVAVGPGVALTVFVVGLALGPTTITLPASKATLAWDTVATTNRPVFPGATGTPSHASSATTLPKATRTVRFISGLTD